MYRSTIVLGLALLMFAMAAWAQAPRIASTDWLAQHLNDRAQRIVDLREDIKAYWAGHVPGAVWVSPDALRWPEAGVPGKLMPTAELKKLLAALGVTSDTTLVIVAEESNVRAAYLAWALDVVGHKQWTILDGGFKQWAAEKQPITQEFPALKATQHLRFGRPDAGVRVTTAQVAGRGGDTVLVDARGRKLYTGAEGPWIRKGHIPGAVSHPWTDDLTPAGLWKSKDDLQAAYTAQGITPDQRIITTCGQGQMSAHLYVTLKYVLGYPQVANHDGGFSEWSNQADLPVTTGETP